MIFGNLFKNKPEMNEESTPQEAPVVPTSPQELHTDNPASVDAARVAARTQKKTKTTKVNTALTTKSRKTRANRVSHIRSSYHKPKQGAKAQAGVSLQERVNLYEVIRNPRLTEKAAVASEENVYVFDVVKNANKHTIADAVELLYKVRPVAVRIAKAPAKRKRIRAEGKQHEKGFTVAQKKAYVSLRKKDKIQLL